MHGNDGAAPHGGAPSNLIGKLGGGALFILGFILAAVMGIVCISEVIFGGFYNASVTLMVVIFGWILMDTGYRMFVGQESGKPGPSLFDVVWTMNRWIFTNPPRR